MGLSSCPVAPWNRRLNSSSFCSSNRESSSSSGSSRSSAAFMVPLESFLDPRADDELRADWEFVGRTADRLTGNGLGHARQLEHDPAGLDHGDPALGIALARAHPRLGRLLRVGLVREDVDADLSATTDVPGHGDTGRLDLPVRHPSGLESEQPVVTEVHFGATLRLPSHPAAMLLAMLHPLRLEHLRPTSRALALRRPASGRTAATCGTWARVRASVARLSRRNRHALLHLSHVGDEGAG